MATVPKQLLPAWPQKLLQIIGATTPPPDVTSAFRQFLAAALVPIASGQVTLVAGTATVSVSSIGSSSRALTTRIASGGTLGHLTAVCTTGTMTITSSAAETSVIAYYVFNP